MWPMKVLGGLTWMGVALAVGLALSAQATLFVPLGLGDLAKKADLVVHGVVLAKHSEADSQGRIFTKVELQVIEVWKGEVKGSPLTVVHGGGELNGRRSMVTGQVDYKLGQETVAFLVRNARGEAVTLGLAQGQFQIWKDAVTGEKLARNIFLGGGSATNGSIQKLDANANTRLTLDSLKRQVKESAQ
jgi:hypothetical protein